MFELSQTFSFDAAHTLKRQVSPDEAASSRRIHGHTYTAEVSVKGPHRPIRAWWSICRCCAKPWPPCALSWITIFWTRWRASGAPTLENLCVFIFAQVRARIPNVSAVSVSRAAGDRCVYRPQD